MKLIGKYISNIYYENTSVTNGASYCNKTLHIKNVEVNLEIWDTGGNKRTRRLTELFIRDSNINCLTYDITSPESFNNIKNFWYKHALKNGKKDSLIAIIGCKSDLYGSVDQIEVEQFAKRINAPLILTSSKKGYNIDLLFETIANEFLNINFFESEYKKCLKKYISY